MRQAKVAAKALCYEILNRNCVTHSQATIVDCVYAVRVYYSLNMCQFHLWSASTSLFAHSHTHKHTETDTDRVESIRDIFNGFLCFMAGIRANVNGSFVCVSHLYFVSRPKQNKRLIALGICQSLCGDGNDRQTGERTKPDSKVKYRTPQS